MRPIYDLGLPIVDDDEPPRLIWLPQSLVACEPGMAPRTSPLSMLRATGRADLLGLLIDLYGQHDLPGGWGIDRRVLQWRHEGRRLHEGKTWTVWGFTPIGLSASESWPPAREFVGDITGHDDRVRREGEFWNALQTIVRFGLAEWVPALCEAAPGGEVIHSLTHAGGLSLERDAFAVARAAALSLLPAPLAREAALSVDILIPVPSAFGDVKMAGIFRLTRLPDTTATRAWLAKMENLRENLGVYEAIVASNQRPPRPQAIGRA